MTLLIKKITTTALITALMVSICPVAQSATIYPMWLVVKEQVKEKKIAAVLNINNSDGDHDLIYDVHVMAWTGVDAKGVNVTEDTTAILSRPVVTVPAHKIATVRFIANERSKQQQDNFRVKLMDITPQEPGTVAARIAISLPLFVINSPKAKGHLELSADGTVTNTGGRHMRITSYKTKDGETVKALRYILPGQSAALNASSLEDIVANDLL